MSIERNNWKLLCKALGKDDPLDLDDEADYIYTDLGRSTRGANVKGTPYSEKQFPKSRAGHARNRSRNRSGIRLTHLTGGKRRA